MPAPAAATNAADPLSDKLVRAGRGDEAAFAEVYDDIAPRVFGMALRVIGDLHEAEEAAQAAFADIWRQAARFDPRQGSATSWVMALAHRRAVTCVRSTRGTGRSDGTRSAPSSSVAGTSTGQGAHQRRAVELAYLDGYTYTDVSSLMRERPDEILSQMGRALRSFGRQS